MAVDKHHAAGSDFATTLPNYPDMNVHRVTGQLDDKLYQPYLPRANLAVSVDRPNGTPAWSEKHQKLSTLEQHVLFWDRDRDGIIHVSDTYRGFKELGYATFWAILSVFIIHSGFSYFSSDSWIPDPFFRITVKNIHRTKHGSDTGTYDTEGRFIPSKFEAIFSKYDREGKGGLSWMDGLRMIRGNRLIADPIGWTAAFFEWTASYLLIWPRDGIVSKESMRSIYDGSIFFDIAEKEKTRSHSPLSGFAKQNKPEDLQFDRRTALKRA